MRRGNIAGRVDVNHNLFNQYIHKRHDKAEATLGSLCIEEPSYGTSAVAMPRTDEKQPKYIRITDFDDFGIEPSHEYMTAESYSDRHLLQEGDILFARTGGTVGKTYYYDGSIGEAVFAGYCIRFRFDNNKVLPKFAYWSTKTDAYKAWVKGIQRPSGQPNINKEEYKACKIILPDMPAQVKLASGMDAAISVRNEKLQQADKLLMEFEGEVSERCNLRQRDQNKMCYAVKYSQLDGVIDAKRYSAQRSDTTTLIVSDVCDILDSKVNAAGYGKDIIDWIRIDDMPNRPLDIDEVRTQPADEIEGSFFEVEENDILVARLGPTILNQKIVMVRAVKRTTIASSEFLVLRCKKGYDPEAVMCVLKTKYFRDLMYSYARGSTPSRYRLSREDMQSLPFPDIRGCQRGLAKKANEIRERVKVMRLQAEEGWQAAKVQFEKELSGE